MEFSTVSVIFVWWLFVGVSIKNCDGVSPNNTNLCAFSKSKQACLCVYKTDSYTYFPVLVADCTRMNMDTFPVDGQLPNVEVLDLSHNLITRLDSYVNNFKSSTITSLKLRFNRIFYVAQDFFQNMPNLQQLDLSNNQLASFSNSNIFTGLKNLRFLSLAFNELSSIPEGLFSVLPNLEELDLRQNYLGSLMMNANNLFDSRIGVSQNITTLKLDGLGIYELNYTFFEGALRLQHLSLAYNPLNTVPAVPYSLTVLDMSGTRITSLSAKYLNYHSLKILKLNKLQKLENIEHYAFYNLQALEELELNDCKNLQQFNDLAFGVLDNQDKWALKKISLARSGLRNISNSFTNLFSGLEHIDLQSNPWDCSCDILWLQSLNKTLHNRQTFRCISPYYLIGKAVMDLTENDLPGCYNTTNYFQRILISIIGSVVAVLAIFIIYLIYLGPFYNQTKHRNIGPDSPYYGNTIGLFPARAEYLN